MKVITVNSPTLGIKEILVDDEDYEYLIQWNWYAKKSNNSYYAVSSCRIKKQKNVSMHRVIMNTPKGMVVDHVNHNGLDNQKHNLRNCTDSENKKNRISCGKSKYLGVSILDKKRITQKWRATIRVNGKQVHLGVSKDEKVCAQMYNDAAIKYHGEFANINII